MCTDNTVDGDKKMDKMNEQQHGDRWNSLRDACLSALLAAASVGGVIAVWITVVRMMHW